MLMVEVWPEKGEKSVSGVKRPRSGCGQVGEQGEPFGLRQHAVEQTIIATAKVDRSQHR
jgi:hypothetical protein